MGYPTYDTRPRLRELLAATEDLSTVTRAAAREHVIRDGMARTGEDREVVAEMVDAIAAMGQEEVLELTDGEPTTLRDALGRYLDQLEKLAYGTNEEAVLREQVAADLISILNYPWSGEEERVQLHEPHYSLALHVVEAENRDLEIRIGANRWLVATVNWEDAGTGGQRCAEQVARAVHRAVLARVIADRDHHVQLNAAELASLVQWATNSAGGSWSPDRQSRVSVDAVAGGGVLVRTRPYGVQQSTRLRP